VETPEFEFYRRRLKLKIDGRYHRFRLYIEQPFISVAFNGIVGRFEIYTPKEWSLMPYMPERVEQRADNTLVCPMPGLVVGVLAQKGERVYKGQNLVILESMKMESGVASPIDGVIAEVRAVVGQAVEAGEILMRFEP
jgi:propionyl-CoA carboxylase alpha chain